MSNDDDLTDALRASIERLAETLLGPSNRKLSKRGRELRFGTKGSVSIALQGARRGSWFDHEADFGGGPLQLIVHAKQCGYEAGKAWAREWLGLTEAEREASPVAAVATLLQRLRGEAEDAADIRRRIDTARGMWGASVPVSGTLGEVYLTGQRGIPTLARGWPDAIRFHPVSRALVVAATADDGTVLAVQRVMLSGDGRKVSQEAAQRLCPPTVKITNGVTEGAVVRLRGLSNGPLLLAEGPETGLSLWAATGIETWIALGSINRLQPPYGRRIIVGREDDARYSPAERAVTRAIHDWRRSGREVAAIMPWRVRRYDASDFNDVIRQEGPRAVSDAVMRAINPRSGASARPRESADAIRWGVTIGACHLFAIATEVPPDAWIEPFAIGCRVDTGLGKSAIARAAAAEALALLRKRGDNRTIAVAVPTHKLGDEQVAAFRELATARKANLVAAVWRGREADDPAEPGAAMCRNPEAVRDAIAAGMDVQSAACRRPDPAGGTAHECQHFERCGYQRQRRQRADLWLVPHETLFVRKPEAIGDLAALVVDESVWQSGLVGVGGDGIALSLDELASDATVPGSPIGGDRLTFLRNRLRDALRAAPDGPLRRETLLAADLTSDTAQEARALEQRRRTDCGMVPGQAAAERSRLALSSPNAIIPRLTALWHAVAALLADSGPEASGWAALADAATGYGRVRAVKIKGRKPIAAGWRVPALLIDATLDARLVQPYWPFYCPAVDLAAVAPWQRVRQAAGRSYSKASLMPADGDKATLGLKRRALRGVAATLGREARRYAGEALVVTNKAVEDALPAVWHKPANVETAHFNAVAGRDGWRDVAFLATVGSTNPPPAAVEELAEALTGEHVPPLAGWYERHATTRETADGYADAETDRHPHPIAEAIRWQIREGEVIQAMGRARGVNRTAANPVDVLVMGDAVLPIPVESVDDADLDPSPADLMLAAGGVALDSPTHAAACYPGLWPSAAAAKQAFSRAGRAVASGVGDISYKKLLIEDVTNPRRCDTSLGRADYRLASAGQRDAVAWFDPATIPDPAAWLREWLGALAWFRLTAAGGVEKAA